MTNGLPEPSRRHATCAWCSSSFSTIVELLEHVDVGHLDGTVDQRPTGSAQTTAIAA